MSEQAPTSDPAARSVAAQSDSREQSDVESVAAQSDSREQNGVEGVAAQSDSREQSDVESAAAQSDSREQSDVESAAAQSDSREQSDVESVAAQSDSREQNGVEGAVAAERSGGTAANEPLTYEQAAARVEEIIRRLDSGEATLNETVALVGEGKQLIELCARELESVSGTLQELRLDELVERLERGSQA